MNSIFRAFYKHNPNFIKHMTATSFIQILLLSGRFGICYGRDYRDGGG